MGHSFGGTLTQLLLARGLGSAGVVGRLRPDRGRPGQPAVPGQVAVPGAEEPGQPAQGGRLHAGGVPLRLHQHPQRGGLARRSGTATPSPAPGNWVWEYGLFANFKPGHQETWVDYDADRAPLLFIGGEKDHIMPPSVNKSNAKHYKQVAGAHRVPRVRGPRPLDLRRAGLGGGRRLRPGVGPGARPRATAETEPRGRRWSARSDDHLGGPDRPGRARRLADPDGPDLRPARSDATASASAPSSTKTAGPALSPRSSSEPVDVVLLSHDHHADNLDDRGRALLPARGDGGHHDGRAPAGSRPPNVRGLAGRARRPR